MTDKQILNLRKFKLDQIPLASNVLIVGPSASRKNECILKIISGVSNSKVCVVTETTEYWEDIKQAKLFDPFDRFPRKAMSESEIRVLENVGNLTNADFGLFANHNKMNVLAVDSYDFDVPKAFVQHMNYVILLGGLKSGPSIRKAWKHYGTIVQQLRDFRGIYLHCTDEGDRYSDDFMAIRLNPDAQRADDVLFWGSLTTPAQVEDISCEISHSLVLNKMHTAEVVNLAEETPLPPSAKQAVKAEVSLPEDLPEEDGDEEQCLPEDRPEDDDDDEEREPRADCAIM